MDFQGAQSQEEGQEDQGEVQLQEDQGGVQGLGEPPRTFRVPWSSRPSFWLFLASLELHQTGPRRGSNCKITGSPFPLGFPLVWLGIGSPEVYTYTWPWLPFKGNPGLDSHEKETRARCRCVL